MNELEEVFNELRLDLYDFSVANGSIGPEAQREFADQMGANLTKAQARLNDLIGQPPADSHPDEWKPRDTSWHKERLNWQAQIKRLERYIKRNDL